MGFCLIIDIYPLNRRRFKMAMNTMKTTNDKWYELLGELTEGEITMPFITDNDGEELFHTVNGQWHRLMTFDFDKEIVIIHNDAPLNEHFPKWRKVLK
jgi:hypothetical protein